MIYPIVCKCGFKGDVIARASQAARLTCPECASPAEQDYSQKNIANGNREFSNTARESLTEFYHSSEVSEARRELGTSGHCVQPDGSVKFKNRSEQRRYMSDKKAMKRRFEQTNAVKADYERKTGAKAERAAKAKKQSVEVQ